MSQNRKWFVAQYEQFHWSKDTEEGQTSYFITDNPTYEMLSHYTYVTDTYALTYDWNSMDEEERKEAIEECTSNEAPEVYDGYSGSSVSYNVEELKEGQEEHLIEIMRRYSESKTILEQFITGE